LEHFVLVRFFIQDLMLGQKNGNPSLQITLLTDEFPFLLFDCSVLSYIIQLFACFSWSR